MAKSKKRILITDSLYKQAIEALRKFATGFDAKDGYDLRNPYSSLSNYRKTKFKKYLEAMSALTSRPHKVVRPRNKKNLKSLQQFSRHPDDHPAFKVAFLPVADPKSDIQVVYRNHKVFKIKEPGRINRREFSFNMENLVVNPEEEVREAIAELNSDRYLIRAGEFEIPSKKALASDYNTLLENVLYFMNKYDESKGFDPNNKNSSHYSNWLFGVVGYDFDNTGDWRKFQQAKAKIRELTKELRKTRSEKKRKELLKELAKYRIR